MKTSILISGFAALCLMIAFAESPSRHCADKNNAGHVDRISFMPVNQASTADENKVLLITNNAISEAAPLSVSEDFSYLKFNVADYINIDADAALEPDALPESTEPYYSYLKFDVNNYTDNAEVSSLDDIELPSTDLEYLRFDATFYSEQNTDSFETMDLPGDNFEYLKFDVKDYAGYAEISSLDDIELPANDLEYLRFDVNNYLEPTSGSFETMDLPEDNFTYLKFDVNDYAGNAEISFLNYIELPANDLEYLRFDVNNYLEPTSDAFEIMELHGDNFTYLKFDVNKYTEGSNTEAGAIGELPVTEALSFSLF